MREVPGLRFVAGFWLLVSAFGVQSVELAGEAFSDPDARAAVPPGWADQPIRYEAWATGADLAITLDQHLYHALLPAVQRFAQRERIDIVVKEGTCGISAGKLMDRAVDMGGFCCAPGLDDRLPGLRYVTLGIGALAVVVHRDNPVDSLPLAEARALFQGERYRWDQVAERADVPNGFVLPIGRLHCKRRPGHWRLLLDNENLFSPRLLEVNTIPDMLNSVANDPTAIGYEVLWMLHNEGVAERVRTVALDGVRPDDVDALAAGRYPLYRAFNIAIWEGAAGNPHAAALAEHLKRTIGDLDGKYGIVPVDRLRDEGWRFRGDELVGEPR